MVWSCNECVPLSFSPWVWSEHFRLTHLKRFEETKNGCLCELNFLLSKEFAEHFMMKHLKKSIVCNKCLVGYGSLNEYKVHLCNETEMCQTCGSRECLHSY